MTSGCSQIDINVTLGAIKLELRRAERPVPAILQDRFSGVSALVVSAGPSAKYWREVYNSIPDPKIVVCIKQSIELQGLTDLCHIHFCNSWNLKRYRYDKSRVIRIFTDGEGAPPSMQKWDVRYTIDEPHRVLEASLAAQRNFTDWTIGKSGLRRPFGPGIMYECVFFTLVHMGVSQIRTVGWDIADSRGGNTHFYDSTERAKAPSNNGTYLRRLTSEIVQPIQKVAIMLGARTANRIFRYWRGSKYNLAGMMDQEANIVAESLPELYRWLEKESVSLTCVSDSPWMTFVASRNTLNSAE